MLRIIDTAFLTWLVGASFFSVNLLAAEKPLLAEFESTGIITSINLSSGKIGINNTAYIVSEETTVQTLSNPAATSIWQYPLESGMRVGYVSVTTERDKPKIINKIMIFDKDKR